MNKDIIKKSIEMGNVYMGIELGSTRIKAVLIDDTHTPIASGAHDWSNSYENGVWTYSMDSVKTGIEDAYRNLKNDVKDKYSAHLKSMKGMGFSAMMHGYLPFDKNNNQLAPFRTWRNTITEEAANELTELFKFNIPQRWSVAHLYQAILNKEEHTKDIAFLTTLAGYVHFMLTGKKVLGVGEASGMFPIDSDACNYDENMIKLFNDRASLKGFDQNIENILPSVLSAGDDAGVLTPEGALYLDPTGELESGIPLCPPEGDAGTGMVATNSVEAHTGNVSAGTSIFAMVVLDKMIGDVYKEIDMVTTPVGKPVAMVHCNTCTSDLDAWVKLFGEVLENSGCTVNKPQLYDMLYGKALEAEADCGGVVNFNYYSGEPVAQTDIGCPMMIRKADSDFSLANFMRAQLFSTTATLRLGMDILFDKEHITLKRLLGHGGLFKTKEVGQRLMAGAMNTPVAVMETAGEGGAWGIALLSAYMCNKNIGQSLESYLDNNVFGDNKGITIEPKAEDVDGFNAYMEHYKAALKAEKAAALIY